MLHSRTLSNKINRLHDESAVRIAYSDYKSSFNNHLEKDGSFQSYWNINFFTNSPVITGDIIKLNRLPTYNIRTHQELYSGNPKTVRYDTETISFFALKIWAIVPQNIKTSLLSFNINIRKWKVVTWFPMSPV